MQEALGQSESFLAFQEHLSEVAPVDRPVLLLGERGTGKELAASRLHYLSKRWDGSFVTLNCATLSPTLLESELFGYEKGAFTGADARKIGRFEQADGGTLFLDEIGSIPLEAQEKILRVVEYKSFERVGSAEPIDVDVRIVGAANVNLAAMAEQGRFKSDLLDRLSFEVLFLPPLRYRSEDIMLLAKHFAARMSFELGREEVAEFSGEAIDALHSYQWPGNVRELKNVVERAVYQAKNGIVEHIVFNPFTSPFGPLPGSLLESQKVKSEKGDQVKKSSVTDLVEEEEFKPLVFNEAVKDFEISIIQKALGAARYNQKQAAELLGMSYDQFRGKIKKYKDYLRG